MTGDKKVFIVGPGFIGWNVLDLLISEGYSVTGYVRRKEHGEQIKASGASVVIGDLNDKASITEQTIQHDVVIHTATADHLPSAVAILDGIKQRASAGRMTTYIHTSGTSVLDDGAGGMKRSDDVYHDNVKAEVDSVPEDAPHREIDLAITKAQKEIGDKAKIAIMIPPLIYGCKYLLVPSYSRVDILTQSCQPESQAPHDPDPHAYPLRTETWLCRLRWQGRAGRVEYSRCRPRACVHHAAPSLRSNTTCQDSGKPVLLLRMHRRH